MSHDVVDDGIRQLIELAKVEDLGPGDLSTNLVDDARKPARFRLLAKQPCRFAGCRVAPAVLAAYDEAIRIEWTAMGRDGAAVDAPPAELAYLTGPLGSILSAERVLLNFLQRLCGVATLTRQYVAAIEGTGAVIYDTRKTVPGWRRLDKYAVRCGGGCNHRQGLYDAVMLKNNHLAGVPSDRLPGAVFDMLNRLPSSPREKTMVTVEVRTREEFEQLCRVVGVNVALLDNFTVDDLRRAVRLRDELGLKGKIELEASGGITLQTVRAVAKTGVERISVGALTHSAPAVDLSLERMPC